MNSLPALRILGYLRRGSVQGRHECHLALHYRPHRGGRYRTSADQVLPVGAMGTPGRHWDVVHSTRHRTLHGYVEAPQAEDGGSLVPLRARGLDHRAAGHSRLYRMAGHHMSAEVDRRSRLPACREVLRLGDCRAALLGWAGRPRRVHDHLARCGSQVVLHGRTTEVDHRELRHNRAGCRGRASRSRRNLGAHYRSVGCRDQDTSAGCRAAGHRTRLAADFHGRSRVVNLNNRVFVAILRDLHMSVGTPGRRTAVLDFCHNLGDSHHPAHVGPPHRRVAGKLRVVAVAAHHPDAAGVHYAGGCAPRSVVSVRQRTAPRPLLDVPGHSDDRRHARGGQEFPAASPPR